MLFIAVPTVTGKIIKISPLAMFPSKNNVRATKITVVKITVALFFTPEKISSANL